MKINNILITGASGFVGRNLFERMVSLPESKDSKIILLTHYSEFLKDFKEDNIVVVKGDISDYHFLCDVIAKYNINTIYHLAANAIVSKCANDPRGAYMTNVIGTVNLLEAVRNVGMNTVKKIIVSTSDKVYGHAPHPYTEKTPFEPKYTYESTKACQDIVAQNYFYNYNLPINVIRCSNVYGLHDPNTTRLIPNVIKSINRGENPKVYSGVANFVREFVYIEDMIDAVLLIQEKGKNGEAYCIGGTEEISILDLVKKISKLMNHEGGVDIVEKPANFQEIKEQSIDSAKLKELGWVPKFTLDQGLLECIKSESYK